MNEYFPNVTANIGDGNCQISIQLKKPLIFKLKKKENWSNKQLNEMMAEMLKEMKNSADDILDRYLAQANKVIAEITTTQDTAKIQKVERISERPLIRKKIPNNSINLSELTFKKAVTENVLVRCPHCGQSHAIIVCDSDGNYLMIRNFEKNEFSIISSFNSKEQLKGIYFDKDKMKMEDYVSDLQNLLSNEQKDKDFLLGEDSSILCPFCQEVNSFSHWKEAYEKPVEFFGSEEICSYCGGELVKTPGDTGKETYCCEICKKEQYLKYDKR